MRLSQECPEYATTTAVWIQYPLLLAGERFG